uniref:Uncharacterized protein n=1 Tax=Tetraselmis sp. GSL018 TaxID=582737 RepID=A0A061QU07_9CHLO
MYSRYVLGDDPLRTQRFAGELHPRDQEVTFFDTSEEMFWVIVRFGIAYPHGCMLQTLRDTPRQRHDITTKLLLNRNKL